MATLGKGDMCIFYKDGENLDDVMRITEKENVPSEELMVFLNDKGEPLTLEETNNILMQYYQPLKEFNESNNLEKIADKGTKIIEKNDPKSELISTTTGMELYKNALTTKKQWSFCKKMMCSI